MPEPRETVAEVLKAHRYHQFYECCCCVVDPLAGAARARRMTRDEHLEHAADAVLAALELRQEHRRDTDTRWVTPWVGVHE